MFFRLEVTVRMTKNVSLMLRKLSTLSRQRANPAWDSILCRGTQCASLNGGYSIVVMSSPVKRPMEGSIPPTHPNFFRSDFVAKRDRLKLYERFSRKFAPYRDRNVAAFPRRGKISDLCIHKSMASCLALNQIISVRLRVDAPIYVVMRVGFNSLCPDASGWELLKNDIF